MDFLTVAGTVAREVVAVAAEAEGGGGLQINLFWVIVSSANFLIDAESNLGATMQAMAGMGLLAGPGGERIPPHLEVAKHFIDLLQILEDKTKGNLTPDEQKLLDQVLYEMRMTFVQVAGGAGAAAGAAPRPPK